MGPIVGLTIPATAFAAVVTFNVDISVSATNGHVLRVVGTITGDSETNTITESDLAFIHSSDAPVQLPTLPHVSDPTAFEWSVSETELRFVRTSTASSSVVWRTELVDYPAPEYRLYLGTGNQAHYLIYSELLPGDPDNHIVELLAASGPDAPGFLVGTAATVPEPSSTAIWSLGVLGLAMIRRR